MKVKIESSVALTVDQKKLLIEKLNLQLKVSVDAEFIVDTKLIGGIRITTPTRTYDLSVKARLSQLADNLTS